MRQFLINAKLDSFYFMATEFTDFKHLITQNYSYDRLVPIWRNMIADEKTQRSKPSQEGAPKENIYKHRTIVDFFDGVWIPDAVGVEISISEEVFTAQALTAFI
jgi:hypothetical protein